VRATTLPIGDDWEQRVHRGLGPHPYDPRLPVVAAHVAELIAAAWPHAGAEHVGSTAVPGLPGKGIVDLQIAAAAHEIPVLTEALLGIGFRRQAGRNPFPATRPMLTGTVRHDGVVFGLQCHIVPDDHPDSRVMLEFRDRLRRSATLRDDYAALKERIVETGTSDAQDYTAAKTEFIVAALALR
jgi:dephospho-CoA kinase